MLLQIESDEDVLWQLEHRETHDEIRRRGVQFVQVRGGTRAGEGDHMCVRLSGVAARQADVRLQDSCAVLPLSLAPGCRPPSSPAATMPPGGSG